MTRMECHREEAAKTFSSWFHLYYFSQSNSLFLTYILFFVAKKLAEGTSKETGNEQTNKRTNEEAGELDKGATPSIK